MSDLLELSAAGAAEAVRARELNPRELFDAYRARAEANELNAFTWVASEAPELPHGTPLGGVPVAVKDLFCTEGIPSQAGSRILEGYRPPYTATVVQKLADAGAPLLGKTNQDEFAMGSSNENSAFGPVLNPWDRARVPGGSSGGSAAAVAAGLAPWAIGTDTGGSIRQPAALCGIVGMKPTYGACSRYGMIAFASSLDQAGPFTRNVTDAALLLRHMVGRDPHDSTSLEFPDEIEMPRAEDLRGIRLGVPEELVGAEGGVEPGVQESFNATLALAEGLGATIEPCRLPHAPHALSAYYLIAPAEASANLARFDGVRYGLRVDGSSELIEMYVRTRAAGFGAEVKRRIMLGTYALSSGYYDAYYGKAQQVRTLVIRDFEAAFEQADVLVSPSTPTTAFKIGERVDDPMAMYVADLCTIPSDLAGNAALSVPCGLAPDDGLPVGLQVMAPVLADDRTYRVGAAVEAALTGRWGRPLPDQVPALAGGPAEEHPR
jgi:aspartyl-tRNA(Asn)/glutamyl-tRNA(Gln) amidotransferase subunit A